MHAVTIAEWASSHAMRSNVLKDFKKKSEALHEERKKQPKDRVLGQDIPGSLIFLQDIRDSDPGMSGQKLCARCLFLLFKQGMARMPRDLDRDILGFGCVRGILGRTLV